MKIAFAAIAALSLAVPAFASATTNDNAFAKDTAVLQLKGIDFSTVDGQQRLAIRMDQAARTVCGDRVATIHLALEDQARACRAGVVADIRSQIEARHVASVRKTGVQLASR